MFLQITRPNLAKGHPGCADKDMPARLFTTVVTVDEVQKSTNTGEFWFNLISSYCTTFLKWLLESSFVIIENRN